VVEPHALVDTGPNETLLNHILIMPLVFRQWSIVLH